MEKSVYRQLIIRVVLPVIIVIGVIEYINFINVSQILVKSNESKRELILDQIKRFQEFEDLAMEVLESRIDERLENLSDMMVNEYFESTEDILNYDLEKIRRELDMNLENEDIYIITKKLIVRNTTFEPDKGLDFKKFGEKHIAALNEIFMENRFHGERFAIENHTKRFKKYSYQATNDNEYLVQIGVYSDKADKIINLIRTNVAQVARKTDNIKHIDLFVGTDTPFPLTILKDTSYKDSPVLEQVFKSQLSLIGVKDTTNNRVTRDYIYVDRQASGMYKGSVIRITYNDSTERDYLRRELIRSLLAASIVSVIILLFMIWLIGRDISNPLIRVTELLKRMAQGDINQKQKLQQLSADEIGEIAKSVNTLIDTLNGKTKFAHEIGHGNLNAQLTMASERDILGKALLEMRDSLIAAEQEKEERRKMDIEQTWTSKGVTIINELLRQEGNITQLADKLLYQIIKHVGFNQGGFFVLSQKNDKTYLEMMAAYAYDQKKHIEKEVVLEEGLLGNCVKEQETIYLTEIPQEYISIESGLGDSNPTSLILLPLKFNNEVFGVIELAAFKKLKPYELAFLERACENIASTISNLRISNQTQKLLEESQVKSQEFKAHEYEMRQTIESMHDDKRMQEQEIFSLKQQIMVLENKLNKLSQG